MYKCNPDYECHIPPFPGKPLVSRRLESSPSRPSAARAGTPSATKRLGSDWGDFTDTTPRKKQRTTFHVDSDDDDSDEIQELHMSHEATRTRLRREKERKERAELHAKKGSFRMSSLVNDLPPLNQDNSVDAAQSPSKPSTAKEKISMETDPVQTKRAHRKCFFLAWYICSNKRPESWDSDPTFRSSKRAKFYHSAEETPRKDYLRAARANTSAARRSRMHPVGQKARAKERDFWNDVDFSQFKGVKISIEQDSEEPITEPAVKEEKQPQPATQEPSMPRTAPEEASRRRSPPIVVDSDDDSGIEANGHSNYAKPTGGAWSTFWENVEDSEDERERRLHESRKKMDELNNYDRRVREERLRRAREHEARMDENRRREQRRYAEKLREEEQRRKTAEKENRQREAPHEPWHQTNAPWSDSHFSHGSGRSNGFNFEWFNSYLPFGSRSSTFGSSQARFTPTMSSSPINQWTTQNALDRYNKLSETFDAFKGTTVGPVPPLDQIPWPVLFKPGYSIERIDWESVEKFFEAAERLMLPRPNGREMWKEFLKASTRRFHPDRWRARGIIGENGYGPDIEDKVNHVSKVLTPLYRKVN